MDSRFSKLLALAWDERALFAQAALLLPLTWLALKLLGLSRLQARLSRPTLVRSAASGGLAPERMGYLVNAAASHSFFPANCLTRSLLLAWLLHRRGVRAELRVGVRRDGDSIHAHAWVEHNGVPLNDSLEVSKRFAALRPPRARQPDS